MSLPKKLIMCLGLAAALSPVLNAKAGLYGFSETNPYADDEKILKLESPPKHIVNYRKEMRDNIEALSGYGKQKSPDFIILVHEDEEVLGKSLWEHNLDDYNKVIAKKTGVEDDSFLQTNPVKETLTAAVDGIIKNNILCGQKTISDNLENSHLVVFSTDECSELQDYDLAIERSIDIGIPFYGFIGNGFQKIKKQPIIKENVNNIHKLSDAKNIIVLIDDSQYKNKQDFINDIANSNYDIVIIKPLFHDKDPITPEEVNYLRQKKSGAKRLLIAMQNISEAKPSDYFWNKKWKQGSPSWLVRPSFSTEDALIARYWDNEWKKIISSHFKSIVDSGYDGAFLTGLENHKYFEHQTPLN